MNYDKNAAVHADDSENTTLYAGGGNGCFSSSYPGEFVPNPSSPLSKNQTMKQPEKKQRLAVEQVQRLETSFDLDNKLDPRRKSWLAKELGLEARQVAIWFQNRRARLKGKRIENEYYTLKANYDSLKEDYDSLLKEKERLQNEVSMLSNELKLRNEGKSYFGSINRPMSSIHLERFEQARNMGKTAVAPFKQGEASSMRRRVFDYESSQTPSIGGNKPAAAARMPSLKEEDPSKRLGPPPMGSEFGFGQLEGDVFESTFNW